MTTFIGDCNMFGTGSISGLGFGAQTISSATYSGVSSNQLTINLQGTYTSFNVVRTNITGGNTITTFTGQTGSTFTDNALSANTQYSYSLIPISSGNDGPTFPLPPVWTLVNVSYNTFSNTYNSVQINWTGVYSSISVTRTSPTTGTPTGSSSNYPASASPQTSVVGYLTDTGLSYNTFIYTIVATNGGGVATTITTKYTTSIPELPFPTFGTPGNVSASSYSTYNYWIITGNTTVQFEQPTKLGYILVGGGGPGANSASNFTTGGGGGGGGGVCWSTKSASATNVEASVVYTITVGTGSTTIGTGGSPTTFSGDAITTLTANGGGSGGYGFRTAVGTVGAGGSSSGGINNNTGGSGSGGSSGVAGEAGPIVRISEINKIYQFGGGGGGGSGTANLGGNGGAGGGGNGANSSNYINAGSPSNGALATYYGGGGGGQVLSNTIISGYNGFVLIYY